MAQSENQTTAKPVYCPRRRQHDAECETPTSCAGGIDCRLGPDIESQRVTYKTTVLCPKCGAPPPSLSGCMADDCPSQEILEAMCKPDSKSKTT